MTSSATTSFSIRAFLVGIGTLDGSTLIFSTTTYPYKMKLPAMGTQKLAVCRGSWNFVWYDDIFPANI